MTPPAQQQRGLAAGALQPVASVIIPSSGRPLCLEATLDALCTQQPGSGTFEVIVADDGCEPPLHARLAVYMERLHLRSVRLDARGPSAARNAAARLARAPLLLFLDDDCVPAEHWLRTYLQAHAADPDSALVGPLGNGSPESLGAEAYHLIFEYLYTRHIRRDGVDEAATSAPFMLSANFGVAREAFHAIGGFDERFRIAAEDREFSERWVRSGRKLMAVPDAIAQHNRPLSVRRFLDQSFRFGRGRTMLQRTMRERGWIQNARESPSFYFRLVTFPMRRRCMHSRPFLLLMLLLSQVLTVAGSLFERAAVRDAPLERDTEHQNVSA